MIFQHTYKIIIDQLGKCNVPLLNANISTSIPAGGSILNFSNDDFDVRSIRRITIPIQAYLLRRFGKVL